MDKQNYSDDIDSSVISGDDVSVSHSSKDSYDEVANNVKDKEEIPPLTYREMKALKRSKYAVEGKKFTKSFLLRNKRTGQIAEIRAASSLHACNFIGWKANRVQILETKDLEDTSVVS